MLLLEHAFECPTRSIAFKLYALGDLHIGALNCAEEELSTLIQRIRNDPQALWVGGGDICDAVILNDAKRFDVNTLPTWMLTGSPGAIKSKIGDMLYAQRQRFLRLVKPIKDKCLGLIEGNHEFAIYKHHNRDHMAELCQDLNVPNLTDCAFLRLRFLRPAGASDQKAHSTSVVVFICHGHGEGRTAGAEPNRLHRLAADKDADIVLTGHSHTYHILPPIVMLGAPTVGQLPENPIVHEKYVANWGSFLYTYQTGPSTYASRANYPVRPMYTVETTIEPHKIRQGRECARITMNGIKL